MLDSQPILSVAGVTKRFGGVAALKDVNFTLEPGEVHALSGENGAGKSTLIKVISGIWPHGSYQGTIEVASQPAAFKSIADAERAGIAVIYQELALIEEMSIAENIFLGAEPTRAGLIDWHAVYSRTAQLLDRFGLDLDPAATVADLGVGQQQLVEIVKALGKESKILLLDEPTAALTDAETKTLLKIVADLKARGLSCIYISHKLDEVFEIADRITVLRDGASIATLNVDATDKNEVVRHMVGREIRDYFPRRKSSVGEPLLVVHDLTVQLPGQSRVALKNVSFEVRAGEVLGLGGLMGAGRTELLMHLFAGVGQRVSGEVTLLQHRQGATRPSHSIQLGLMLVSEDRKRYGLNLDQSIGFNMSLSTLKRLTRRGLLDADAEYEAVQKYFASLGIKASGQDEIVANLSGGNQQKVVLGRALMTEPAVVFLDEPTRGIDVGAKIDVYHLINELTAAKKAVVMVSSELPELMGMCDRIAVLSAGQIGGEFTGGQVTQEEILKAAMRYH